MAQTSKMASKRNLYRPAQVQENVGQRKNRKTLAQGRLITSGGVAGAVKGNNSSLTNDVLSTSHISNTSGNVSHLHQTSLVQGQLNDSLFSPRRAVPRVTEPRSPHQGHPAGSLDLSDSDGDQSADVRLRYQRPSEVLCIDAARQTVNPDVSEVDIRIGTDNSPVKIVCHSPARTNHSLRNGPTDQPKTPIILKEKLTDDHINPQTAVQSIPMSPLLEERHVLRPLPSNLPQPNFDNTGDSDILHGQGYKLDADDQLLGTSDNDLLALKDNVVIKNHKTEKAAKFRNDRIQSSVKKEPQKRPDTGKKKKGRVIQSRYMQMAETKAKASLSARMDKSSFDKSNKVSRSMDATPSMKRHTKVIKSAESHTMKRPLERPHTPENQSITSTGGDHLRLQSSTTCSGKTRSRLKHDIQDDLMGQSILSNVSIYNQSTVSSKPKQKLDNKSLQQQLDLQYMYDLQWSYLEARAKKSFQDQEKQAMSQIYGLHEEVEKLRKQKAEKEQHYARLKHTNMTDTLAEVQRQCLGPVTNALPNLQKQYRCLAQALDTTRHQIPTKDIYLPADEDQFQATLEANLLESERLLGEISATTRQDTPTIVDMATALVSMETAVDGMETELKKSRELLAATETLTMHQCSLRVQEIQLNSKS